MAEEEQKLPLPPGEGEGEGEGTREPREGKAADASANNTTNASADTAVEREDKDRYPSSVATFAEFNPATLDADLLEQWEERQAELAEKLATARKLLQSKAMAESKRKQQEAMVKYDKLAAEVREVEKRRKDVEQKVETLKRTETEDSRHDADLEAEIEHVEQERLLDKIALLRMKQRDIYEERSALDKAVQQHEIFIEAVQLENEARGNRRKTHNWARTHHTWR